MNKHTDGPWALDLGEVTGTFVVYQDGSQDAIATVWDNYSEKENDANARLIAAAPDFLAAAEQYFSEADYLKNTEMHDNYTDRARSRGRQAQALEQLRAAVAKAQS